MPKLAANLTMLYTEHPFFDRFVAAKADGFEAVEFMLPYDFTPAQIADELENTGLDLVLLNLPPGVWAGGERGVAVLPERRGEFRDGVDRAIDYARALHCPMVNCLIGLTPQEGDPGGVRTTLVEKLRYAAPRLAAVGVKLLIGPVNGIDIPGFDLDRVEKAVAVLDEVGADNLFLQYGLYRRQRSGGDLLKTFRKCKDRIAHVQLADNPGRHEPGTGEIDYSMIFDALESEGYEGWIGCGYKPATGTSAGLGWARQFLKARRTGTTGDGQCKSALSGSGAAAIGPDAKASLDRNDAHTFLEAPGDPAVTGPMPTTNRSEAVSS